MSDSASLAITQRADKEEVKLVNKLRIAIISTPRSGNTWLRHLLSSVYGIEEHSRHNPLDLDWERLPEGCVLQIHWHPVESFLRRLEEYGFHVIAMARHPLDVLISILHFSLHDPTARWLEGEEGNERPIHGAMPRSTAFLDYAVGKRAQALLSVSREWWSFPGATQVLYEVLNRDPVGELHRVVQEVGGRPLMALEEAVALQTIPRLREQTGNEHHFWKGRPGLWKSFLTTHESQRLAQVLQPQFVDFDFDWDADPALEPGQADANWIKLVWADLADNLQVLRFTKRDLKKVKGWLDEERGKLEEERIQREQAENQRENLKADVRGLEQTIEGLRTELEQTRAQLMPYLQLGPLALRMAFRIRTLSARYTRMARAFKLFLPNAM